ncbi:HEAT repeat domain-containing protein [Natronorarus salvus]|uniref:HEAT repeat domain-containing protein n=1 Tax=Natronorarus salvus TaxID=3117733 RepID=UPI002F25FB21
MSISDPDSVDLEALYSVFQKPPVHVEEHADAIVALMNVTRAGEPGERFVDEAIKALERPALNDALSLRCLRQLATVHPDEVAQHWDLISDRISTESGPVTQAASGCCVELVDVIPAQILESIPTLSVLVEEGSDTTRINTMYVLSQIAHTYPHEIKPIVPQLFNKIGDRTAPEQVNALSALGAVTSEFPSAAVSVVDEVALVSVQGGPKARGNGLALLADIAKEHPDTVLEHSSVAISGLEEDDEFIHSNAAAVIIELAQCDSEAVEQAEQPLCELLSVSSPEARRNACRALGHLESTAALESLKTIVDTDPDPEVRQCAAWAIERCSP